MSASSIDREGRHKPLPMRDWPVSWASATSSRGEHASSSCGSVQMQSRLEKSAARARTVDHRRSSFQFVNLFSVRVI